MEKTDIPAGANIETIKFEGSEKYSAFEMLVQNLDTPSLKIGSSINNKLHVQGLLFVDEKTKEETFIWSENAPNHEAMALAYSKYKNITIDDARFQNVLKLELNDGVVGVYSHDRNLRSKVGVFLKKRQVFNQQLV